MNLPQSIVLGALVGVAVSVAWDLLADGRHAAGTPPPACPVGSEWVQVSLGQRVIHASCIATADLERAAWRASARVNEGEVVCRTLIVRR